MNKPILLCAYLLAASAFASATEAATATTDAAPTTVQEVIVTAEKRAENIQDVPITVSVVTSQQIAQHNLTTTSGLVDAIPALTITNDGVFQVRSLGTQGFGRSAEQSVSVEVDGVAMPRPQAYVLANSIFDLDHIEVLSGPQGTLFGKNADAGVINIVTNGPVLGKFEAIGHADVGSHDIVNADGVLNLPLGDDAALRLVLHRDTYGHVVYNTIYNLWDYSADDGVRARLLWKPRDNLAVNLSFDYQDLSSNGVNGGADFAGVSLFTAVAPGSASATALANCGVVPGPNNNRACASSLYAAGASTGDTYGGKRGGGAIQIDWTFWRGLTLTSITALRQHVTGDFGVHADIAGDFGDSLPADDNILKRNLVPTYLRQFSEELRIASPAENRLNYVVGGYYSDTATVDGVDQAGQLGIPGLGALEFRRFETIWGHLVNYAAFGQVNFNVTPKFILLAGGRVTHDNLSDFSFNQFPGSTTATPPNPPGNFIYTGNEGFFSVYPVNSCTVAGGDPGEVADGGVPAAAPNCLAGTSVNSPARLSTTGYNWKAGAEYHFSPDLMVYATATHGYKGPFVNEALSPSATGASDLLIKPESTTSFEIGLKSTLFNRLAVDVSLFDETANNFQTTIYQIEPPPMVSNFIDGNAPAAYTRGVDVSVFGELSRDFSINGDLLYDNAHFGSGFLVSCSSPGPTCPAVNQLPYAPTWKATLGGEYRHAFTDQIQGYLQSDFTYSAKYPYSSTPATAGGSSSGPRYLLGARGVRIDNGKYGIAVFCRNCLGEFYPVTAGPYLFGGATAQYLTIDSYRVVGVTLDAKF